MHEQCVTKESFAKVEACAGAGELGTADTPPPSYYFLLQTGVVRTDGDVMQSTSVPRSLEKGVYHLQECTPSGNYDLSRRRHDAA